MSRRNYDLYVLYLNRVLKQAHPGMGVSRYAAYTLGGIVEYLLKRIAQTVNVLLSTTRSLTVTSHEVETALRLLFPGDLRLKVESKATAAVTRYNASNRGVSVEVRGRSRRAGLIFPIPRVSADMRALLVGRVRLSSNGGVYVTAVIEATLNEILRLAGTVAKDKHLTRITPRHIFLGIHSDLYLGYSELLGEPIILQGGVMPGIHPKLYPKTKAKRREEVHGGAYPIHDIE